MPSVQRPTAFRIDPDRFRDSPDRQGITVVSRSPHVHPSQRDALSMKTRCDVRAASGWGTRAITPCPIRARGPRARRRCGARAPRPSARVTCGRVACARPLGSRASSVWRRSAIGRVLRGVWNDPCARTVCAAWPTPPALAVSDRPITIDHKSGNDFSPSATPGCLHTRGGVFYEQGPEGKVRSAGTCT